MSSRDLIGTGGRWPDHRWPNGARLAVTVAVNFEEGAEQQVGDGDPRSEAVGEFASVLAPGTRDRGQEQMFAYGLRAGLWRMLDALDRHGVAATFLMCGRAVERSPSLAAEVARRGHECAAHGWLWRPQADYATREAEAADLDRCIKAIADACGRPPAGFFCRGSESDWTRGLLAERGFLYASNAFDDDLPYRDAEHPGLLVVPYALDSNDSKFFHPNGFVRARELVEYAEDALATLLAEGERGHPRLLNLGFHLRISGRPGRFPAFEGVLERLAALGDRIWIARREEIARDWLAAYPGALKGP